MIYSKILLPTKKLLKRINFSLLLLLTLGNLNSAVAALPVPAPPDVAAKNYYVADFASGKMLAEKNPDAQIEPASITKMMTSYVVYKELDEGRLSMDDMANISEKAWRMGGSRMYLDVNTRVSVHDLLKGLIIQSGNDASVALAEHVAGTEEAFVQLMNQYAADLGMDNTHFVNSTGWPNKQHLTTARDIATLAIAIITEFPEHYAWYAEKEYTYNSIKQYNRNKLLWRDTSVDGIKTGHTESAGYCLVASAERSDMRVISVVLGTNSKKARANVSQALLNYGFRFFESHVLYTANEVLNRPRVWSGEFETVTVGLANDLAIVIPRGAYDKLDATMDIDKNIEAPISKGQQLGVVKVSLEGKELASVPLVALEAVNEGSLFQQVKDYFFRLVE
ncbi:D-alanyl-D-alanine carboxypeptidase [hydrothermal vent metagenome]|uniref:serine-type D-Ala-D-Ala carboxypeptidase n=1 Tax=hydrothermal vent metagenome TaxID=652676 RepID=A0A3B0WJJ5_9ZZZZ